MSVAGRPDRLTGAGGMATKVPSVPPFPPPKTHFHTMETCFRAPENRFPLYGNMFRARPWASLPLLEKLDDLEILEILGGKVDKPSARG